MARKKTISRTRPAKPQPAKRAVKARAPQPASPKPRAARAAAGDPPARTRAAITVVGVGASAGGLEAFSQLLRACRNARHLAIIFIQHLSPNHDSALVPLLKVQTSLTVVQAEERMRVEAGCVYVIPPNVQMEMDGAELHLSPRPKDRSRHTPIDAFLVSLAEAARERAVAVILSGTASDGAMGLAEVKRAGGVTFVQSPDSAKYDGMPHAAIQTGMVDLVLDASA